jgi:hypothetical protein
MLQTVRMASVPLQMIEDGSEVVPTPVPTPVPEEDAPGGEVTDTEKTPVDSGTDTKKAPVGEITKTPGM